MKFCPSCRQEYEDHANDCFDCRGVALVAAPVDPGRGPDEPPPELDPEDVEPVQVLSTASLLDFDRAREALEEAGIPHFTSTNTGGATFAMPVMAGQMPGTSWIIQVPRVAQDHAIEVLEGLGIERATGPWHGTPRETEKRLRPVYWLMILAALAFLLIQLASFLASL